MGENPWEALVDHIADTVVRRLDERDKVNAIAMEVIALLEERWRRQGPHSTGAPREADVQNRNAPGDATIQAADLGFPQPEEVEKPAPSVDACNCPAVENGFSEKDMRGGDGSE